MSCLATTFLHPTLASDLRYARNQTSGTIPVLRDLIIQASVSHIAGSNLPSRVTVLHSLFLCLSEIILKLSCTSRLASARWINICMFYATPSVSSLADWQGICNPTQHQLNPPNCVAKIEEWSITGPRLSWPVDSG